MNTIYPTTSFEVRNQEYHELLITGLTVLRDRWLKANTGVLPKRLVTLTHHDKQFVARVTKRQYLLAGKWNISVQIVNNDSLVLERRS